MEDHVIENQVRPASGSNRAAPAPGRSWLLKLMVIGWLVLSYNGWLRCYSAIREWNYLSGLGASTGPLTLAVEGAAWGLVGLAAGVCLWMGNRWAPILARISAVVLAVSYWAERIFLYRSPIAAANQPFAIGFSIFCLGYVFVVLALPAQRRFFQRRKA